MRRVIIAAMILTPMILSEQTGRAFSEAVMSVFGVQGYVSVIEMEHRQGHMDESMKVITMPQYDFIAFFEYDVARIMKDEN
jgi:DUF917 family protein